MEAGSEASFSFSMFCIKLLDSSESLGLFYTSVSEPEHHAVAHGDLRNRGWITSRLSSLSWLLWRQKKRSAVLLSLSVALQGPW